MTEIDIPQTTPSKPGKPYGLRLALLAGILLWLACPALSLWPLAWIGIAPLILSVTRAVRFRQAFWRGYLFGWIYLGSVWYWTGLTIVAWTNSQIGWLAWFGLTLILALFYGAWAGAAWWIAKRTAGWSRILALSAAWVVLEWARTLGRLTMPWAQISYSQYKALPLLQIAEVTGAYGVSFLVVLFNSTIAEWWRDRTNPQGAKRITTAAATVAIVCVYGAIRLSAHGVGPEIVAAAMQPNFKSLGRLNPDEQMGVFTSLTKQAASSGPIDLFVWPESAAPTDAEHDYHTYLPLRALAEQYHAGIATGSRVIDLVTRAEYNSSVLISPDGSKVQRYDKQQLVPFGEFIPFRDMLPSSIDATFQFPPSDVVSGVNQRTLDFTSASGQRVALGPFICYELMYPPYARAMTRSGANLLITQSNDDWFQSESALEQHLSAVVLRAIENHRWVVRSTSTGITCIIDSSGRIVGQAPVGKEDAVVLRVRLNSNRTIYNRFGDWFVALCGLVLAGGWCLSRTRGASASKVREETPIESHPRST